MGNFIFELSGVDKKTGLYSRRMGKVRGSIEKARREMSERMERFKRRWDNVHVSAGPINILDEKFFKAIK